jgi:hypothetical protein
MLLLSRRKLSPAHSGQDSQGVELLLSNIKPKPHSRGSSLQSSKEGYWLGKQLIVIMESYIMGNEFAELNKVWEQMLGATSNETTFESDQDDLLHWLLIGGVSMDPKQFTERAIEDNQINLLLTEVAQGISGRVSIDEQQRFILGGADILIGIAAYALYRWLKDYFDHRRGMNETEILAQRTEIIAGMVRDGFKPEEAAAIVDKLLENIAKRGADDPTLQLANDIVHGKV